MILFDFPSFFLVQGLTLGLVAGLVLGLTLGDPLGLTRGLVQGDRLLVEEMGPDFFLPVESRREEPGTGEEECLLEPEIEVELLLIGLSPSFAFLL